MTAAEKLKVSHADYFARAQQAVGRLEYVAGEVFAMATGSPRHGWLIARMNRVLGRLLGDDRCTTLASDIAVRAEQSDSFLVPDGSIVCGPPAFDSERALTNPSLLIEVLSPSSEAWDRGRKFLIYKRIPALTDYLLVWQELPRIEHLYRGDGDLWLHEVVEGMDAELKLPRQGISLPLGEVYAGFEAWPAD